MNRRWWRDAVALFVVVGLGPCDKQKPQQTAGPVSGPTSTLPIQFSPKCPGHDSLEVVDTSGLGQAPHGELGFRKVGEIPLSKGTEHVPEVHDCQRLVRFDGGPPKFGALGVLYAASGLKSVFEKGRSRGAATIYSWSAGGKASAEYEPLGIHAMWNCLYLYLDDAKKPTARMVEANSELDCDKPMTSPTAGTPLEVSYVPIPAGLGPDEIPSVARWADDFRGNPHGFHHIWIRCGDQACDVHGVRAQRPISTMSREEREDIARRLKPHDKKEKVVDIHGWYDEQHLAYKTSSGLAVSKDPALLVPSANLGELNDLDPFKDWVEVAYAYLPTEVPGYAEKLNLRRGVNTIFLRRGAKASVVPAGANVARPCVNDEDPWWALIVSAKGDSAYFCVRRYEHPEEKPFPGVVRWRWLEDDETTWIRCPGGCCPIS